MYSDFQPPKIHDWHRAMRTVMKIGESGNVLFPFARHVDANQGWVYPEAPEPQYIQGLKVPNGSTMDFEDIYPEGFKQCRGIMGVAGINTTKAVSAGYLNELELGYRH